MNFLIAIRQLIPFRSKMRACLQSQLKKRDLRHQYRFFLYIIFIFKSGN